MIKLKYYCFNCYTFWYVYDINEIVKCPVCNSKYCSPSLVIEKEKVNGMSKVQ
jgi:hypothetical protein